MPAKARIIIADDHVEMARLLGDQLSDTGYAVDVVASGKDAVEAARREHADLVITDLRMAEFDGFDVLDAIRSTDPDTPVIIMTAFGAIDTAIEAMKRGAYHYITKPLRLDELLLYVERALAERRLRSDNRVLQRMVRERSQLGAMLGHSAKMQILFQLCERVAQAAAPVLIRGESGVGKELVARAIHLAGPRRDRPFVPINCSALPAQLLESELFGHVRGAFTGATVARRGLFTEADGGTLFLDEIGEMDLSLQAKVLRVVEDGEVRAVGSDTARRVDVRLLAATHRDLEKKVRDGEFREDLFYRLHVVPVFVPPLRERREDIPLLARHFFAKARERNPHAPAAELSPALIAKLCQLPWPGNVRELENLIERLVIISGAPVIDVEDLAMYATTMESDDSPLARARSELIPLRQLEAEYIDWVLTQCAGNKTRAAEILGVDVSTIHRRKRGQ